MSPEVYAAYFVACLVVVLVPGPIVTLVLANSLTYGSRAGLLNVAGTQLGLGAMILAVGLGLAAAVATMGWWFDWLRLAGAAYLVYLGWKLWRSPPVLPGETAPPAPRGGFFLQGLLVSLSNPKTLLFFGAFFPQFIDPARDHATQIAIMGGTAMLTAAVADGAWAVGAGRMRSALTAARLRWVNRAGGGLMIGGGIWLALARGRS